MNIEVLTGWLTGTECISGTLSPIETLCGEIVVPQYLNVEMYPGPYVVTPRAFNPVELETQDKFMTDNVLVLKVPYYETTNLFDGKTAYIAEEI